MVISEQAVQVHLLYGKQSIVEKFNKDKKRVGVI